MTFIRCLLTLCSNPFSCPIRACEASTVLFVLAINLIVPTAARANVILVTTTQPGINSDGLCSLQEAIYSANFDNNSFVDPAHPSDPPITRSGPSRRSALNLPSSWPGSLRTRPTIVRRLAFGIYPTRTQ